MNFLMIISQNREAIDTVSEFFLKFFGGINWLVVVFMSMIPIIELKGGILWGMSKGNMNGFGAASFGLLGCVIVSIILVFALKPILDWLKRTRLCKKIIGRIEKSFTKKAQRLEDVSGITEKTTTKKRIIIFMTLLTLFIAIPIPLSGVWTGCAIGIFIGLKRWQVFVASLLGSIISSTMLVLIGNLFGKWTDILFYCMLAVASVIFIILIAKISIDMIKESQIEKKKNLSIHNDEKK